VSKIDWRKVAAAMQVKVEECCACNTCEYLTSEEADELMEAAEEIRAKLKATGVL
jgi:hypothetical protein